MNSQYFYDANDVAEILGISKTTPIKSFIDSMMKRVYRCCGSCQ